MLDWLKKNTFYAFSLFMEIKDLRSAFFFQNQLLEVTGSVRANTFTIIARRNSAVTRAIIFRRATS